MAQCTNCWSWHSHGKNCEIHNATGGNVDAPSTVPYRDCAHGHLARSCEICEYIGETGSLRAQLAQREGEIEALREVLRTVQHCPFKSKCLSCAEDIAAALSDNPESPALTDKEA